MDVVYNHTYDLDSCLQKCEPDYYYRMNGTRYSMHLPVAMKLLRSSR